MSTLTDQEIANIRRWLGYALASAAGVETVYTPDNPRVSFGNRLGLLTVTEEELLRRQYLAPLATLEAAILTAADNLDTLEAGPWKVNPQEVSRRTSIYNKWRRDMAGFLGFAPGPALGAGGITLVRC